MPWKECNIMDERMKFVSRMLEGEKMTDLCSEFGISRVTGYKIWDRYQACGLTGLLNKSRRPRRCANRLPFQIEKVIIKVKKEKPTWGAPKIRELIRKRYCEFPLPAKSTVHAVLERNGFVKERHRRRYKAKGTYLSIPQQPNDLWCADFKGEFRMGDRQYCYPLTISDFASRYLFAAEGLSTTKTMYSFSVFENVFKEYGLPTAIRTDNGNPFSSPNALFGLSYLSVWWLRLGIKLERIKPGHPEQNGRHERMHLTLKKATTKPPAQSLLQQQEKLDTFLEEYNTERPHEALDMKCPGEVYTPSQRRYTGLVNLEYPKHDRTITVTRCGRICMNDLKVSLSKVFANQEVGLMEVDDKMWLVTFMDYDLGVFDEESSRFEPLEDPFTLKLEEKVLTMSPV